MTIVQIIANRIMMFQERDQERPLFLPVSMNEAAEFKQYTGASSQIVTLSEAERETYKFKYKGQIGTCLGVALIVFDAIPIDQDVEKCDWCGNPEATDQGLWGQLIHKTYHVGCHHDAINGGGLRE